MGLAVVAGLLTAATPSPSPVPTLLAVASSPENDYNASLSADGRTMVFARSEAGFAHSRLYVMTKGNGGWTTPRPLFDPAGAWRDSDPWLTPDGQTLYFVSSRPTPSRPRKSDLDIWRAHRRTQGWSEPEHLGDVLNGPTNELGPEIHDDLLYFAAAKEGGLGGLDIYQSVVRPDGFGEPEPLPEPINSAASESDFTVSPDGRTTLFWRQVGDRVLIHMARRAGAGWSAPEPLADKVNIGPMQITPAFTSDGRSIIFASTAPRAGQPAGMADLYQVPFSSNISQGDVR